jgi:serine/threonine-protein kinase
MGEMGGDSERGTVRLRPAAAPTARPTPPSPDDVATATIAPTTGTIVPATSTTGPGSPIDALERDEILRTRTFCVLVMLLAVAGGATAVLIPGGDPRGLAVMMIACSLGLASMLYLLYQTGDVVRYRQPRTAMLWFVPAVSVNAAVLFFGMYSPAPMLAVLGIYFVGQGRSRGLAIVVYATCAATYLAMSISRMLGVPDLGVVRPELSSVQQLFVLFCVQLVLALTIVTARLSRRTALFALGELEQAVRLATQRQALLLEARDELDRALRSKRGRFSEQVIGAYQLGDVLGRGAMGEVYDAIDTRSSTRVAIKLLSHASLGNPNVVLRFFRELRTAASVQSPYVVRVIEIGEHPVPFLVMERLEGQTLSDLLRKRRLLPPEEVVELVSQVATGISAAAAAGIVHRDLKPQNLFRHHDVWKVLDFGVARAVDQGDTLTAGHVVGTPAYMAPEQASGGSVDHRTDLYALAAVAYRAFTGQQPFVTSDVAETLYRVVHTRPVRPTLVVPELPADVDAALAIGMAPRPADRFASGAELADALREAVAGQLAPILRARAAELSGGGWATPRRRG